MTSDFSRISLRMNGAVHSSLESQFGTGVKVEVWTLATAVFLEREIGSKVRKKLETGNRQHFISSGHENNIFDPFCLSKVERFETTGKECVEHTSYF